MIKVTTRDLTFCQAYWNAKRALPVIPLESPRQYGQRWRDTFRCRIAPDSDPGHICYVFDNDEDYTWFIMRWS